MRKATMIDNLMEYPEAFKATMVANLMGYPEAFTVRTVSEEGLKAFQAMLAYPAALLAFVDEKSRSYQQIEAAHEFLKALGNSGASGKELLGRALLTDGFALSLLSHGKSSYRLITLIESVHRDAQKEVLDSMELHLRDRGLADPVDHLRQELQRVSLAATFPSPSPGTGQS